MFKPYLKRNILQTPDPPLSPSTRLSPNLSPPSTLPSQKQLSLIPQAFFQQSKSYFFKHPLPGLTGILNTYQYNYPKFIQSQINSDNIGNFQFHSSIFTFYKDNFVYFWQYESSSFDKIRKYLKHTFSQIITSVTYKQIIHQDLSGQPIKLIIIAFGQMLKLFRLLNFQKKNANSTPILQDLKIYIYNTQIVTHITIIYEQTADSDPFLNSLLILMGDSNGNLTLFDFNTKKKYTVDTLRQKLKRKLQQQTYSQILQILPYKQFIFCLVNRHYQVHSVWKFIQKFLRNPQTTNLIQQRIQVYKIQLNSSYTSLYFWPIFTISKISGFKKYTIYSINQLITKIKASYSKYFDKFNQNDQSKQLGYIQSLSIKNGFVQLMFKSGQSILVDQDLSFAQSPLPCINKPQTLSSMNKILPHFGNTLEKPVLIKSIGTKLMLFQGFIASIDKNCQYFTLFSTKQNNFYTRFIKQYHSLQTTCIQQPSKYLLFTKTNLIIIQQLSCQLILFLYCSLITQQHSNKKYTPQIKKFQQKIDKLLDYFGSTQILIILFNLLMKIKLVDCFSVNLRIDLLQIIIKQLSTDQQITYKQALKNYQDNQKTSIKTQQLTLNKQNNEMLWKIIFKIQKFKIQLPQTIQWRLHQIQSICMTIQVLISEIFKNIKNWTARNFCIHRTTTYHIISLSKILAELIDNYITRQSQQNSRKTSQYNRLSPLPKWPLPPKKLSQSLKIKFCQLSKLTIEKLILLLKVYDYACEMDFYGTSIPKFSDLIFNFNKIHKIQFSQTIFQTFHINNQTLIDSLIQKLPQLQLQQVRRFTLWKTFHQTSTFKTDQHNQTMDTSFQLQIQQLNQFINQSNYQSLQNYYIPDQPPQPTWYNPLFQSNNLQIQKQQITYFINGVIIMLKTCLNKILQLRREQIKISNAISIYKTSSDDYYGVLQLPSLQRKIIQILKQITFYTRHCQLLIQKLFIKYSTNLIQKSNLISIIDSIKNQLTNQVKKIFQKYLDKQKLFDLTLNINKKSIFYNNKNKQGVDCHNHSISQQIANQTIRKYL